MGHLFISLLYIIKLFALRGLPLFKGFSGKRIELVILYALALALLPTMQLAFANPLMPPTVSFYHFVEVSLSTGVFGALCAWFVPKLLMPGSKPA